MDGHGLTDRDLTRIPLALARRAIRRWPLLDLAEAQSAAMLAVAVALRQFQPDRGMKPASWLFRAGGPTLTSLLRPILRAAIRERSETDLTPPSAEIGFLAHVAAPPDEPASAGPAAVRELLATVRLPAAQHLALSLRFADGQPLRTIGAALGNVCPSRAQQVIRAGLRTLRERLGNRRAYRHLQHPRRRPRPARSSEPAAT